MEIDKRLQRRQLRNRELREADVQKAASKLPDHASNVREPTEEELEQLKTELTTEEAVRKDRIRWILETANQPPVLQRVEPIADLED
jgi:hypothetical protein